MTMMLQTKMIGIGECPYLEQVIWHCIVRNPRIHEMYILHNLRKLDSHSAPLLQLGTCGYELPGAPDSPSYKA